MARSGNWRLDRPTRAAVIRLARQGKTHREIGSELRLGKGTVGAVLTPLGGVLRAPCWMPSRRRLQLDDRIEIQLGLARTDTFTAIAQRLGRAVSTVSREVHHHGGRQRYKAVAAHAAAERDARRPKSTKLAANPALCARVIDDLEQLLSPEQIARRLQVEFANPELRVSHETIYKSLYVQGRGELRRELARCLRTGRAMRKPQGRLERRGRIPNMIMISERPAEADDRAVPGHWEGDLIIGANNKSAIATLVERSTRYVLLAHISNQRAETVRTVLLERVATLPAHLWRSLTWDQGREMAEHELFTIDTGIQVYFCDPHSPWQRGSTKTPTACYASTSPKAPASPATPKTTLTPSLSNSTTGPARRSAGKLQPSDSPSSYCDNRLSPPC